MAAIQVGIDQVRKLKEKGIQIIATGEMGIGNTTTSSAVASVLLGKEAEQMTGRGAGLSDEGLEKKIQVIRRAIALHRPDWNDPVDVPGLFRLYAGFPCVSGAGRRDAPEGIRFKTADPGRTLSGRRYGSGSGAAVAPDGSGCL